MESARCLSLLLLKPIDALKVNDIISEGVLLFSPDAKLSTKIHLLTDSSSERVENEWNIGELSDQFQWECPENLRNRLSQAGLLGKRKISTVDGANRHGKGDNAPVDVRGSGPSIAPPIPTRRDTFRQRKPNTSRPPSMHVDDYVARERNSDGVSNPNVIAVPRLGSSGGRPPSIHVDEFMARQRERHNSVAMAGVEVASLGKKVTPENDNGTEKSNRSKQLKVDLDDDLQGIDIVFDAEENEPDDKLPFPQEDDEIQRAASASAERSPQHSIVAETESDAKDLEATVASNADENTQSELSSRMSVSHPGMQLRREPSVSSEKKYFGKLDQKTNNGTAIISDGFDSAVAKTSGLSASKYGKGTSMAQVPMDSRTPPPSYCPDNNLQRIGNVALGGPQGHHEQKYMPNQPPLPPTPPPSTISPGKSQVDTNSGSASPFVNPHNDVQPPLYQNYVREDPYALYLSLLSISMSLVLFFLFLFSLFQMFWDGVGALGSCCTKKRFVSCIYGFYFFFYLQTQTDYQSFGSVPSSLASSNFMLDSRYARTTHSSPGGSNRPLPPLPPTPPPFSTTPLNLPSRSSASQSSVYAQNNTGVNEVSQFAPPPLMPPGFNRPSSMPFTMHGNIPVQQSDNVTGVAQNSNASQPPMQSMQPLPHLQPLQPPQLPCPQLPHQLRPPMQNPLHTEQRGSASQSHVQPQQILQQSQMSPYHLYYQNQLQDNFPHSQQQLQVAHHQGEAVTQQQVDSSMSLQQYFSSPEAIQVCISY